MPRIEYNAELYGLPAFEAGVSMGLYYSSGTTEVMRYERTTAEDFRAYEARLLEEGFVLYDENVIDDSLFATLISDEVKVSLSFHPDTRTMRIVAEERGALCPLNDECEETYPVLLTGMQDETVVAMEGMGYIIRLADGSFCIIDGGMGDPDHVDSDKLMNILSSQNPHPDEKPVIAAWIFTHLHGDHVGVFNCFSLDHHDEVVIEKLMYNFPKESEIAESESSYMLDGSIYRWNQFKSNLSAFYSDVPVVKLHTGDRFVVRNASFEVLFTHEDLYPYTIRELGMNESSLLLKMNLAGQSFLWTGDFAYTSAELVLQEYNDVLSADFLQMPHHGLNGTVELYRMVDPTYALLPVWHGGIAEKLALEQNQWLIHSEKLRQIIATACGTWTITLPYDPIPGSYLRIPSDDTVYPAYPILLGE